MIGIIQRISTLLSKSLNILALRGFRISGSYKNKFGKTNQILLQLKICFKRTIYSRIKKSEVLEFHF